MGPALVERAAPAIEARLLRRCGRARGLRGLGLEGAMHALVGAVLLGRAARNALRANAEADPPHAERREAAERPGGAEGHPVVGANHARQAVLLETAATLGLRQRAPGAGE